MTKRHLADKLPNGVKEVKHFFAHFPSRTVGLIVVIALVPVAILWIQAMYDMGDQRIENTAANMPIDMSIDGGSLIDAGSICGVGCSTVQTETNSSVNNESSSSKPNSPAPTPRSRIIPTQKSPLPSSNSPAPGIGMIAPTCSSQLEQSITNNYLASVESENATHNAEISRIGGAYSGSGAYDSSYRANGEASERARHEAALEQLEATYYRTLSLYGC